MTKFTAFASVNDLNQQLAEQIVARLATGIKENGSASMVVSGGKTPLGLFHCLNSKDLDWDKVCITLADERWVSTDNALSNEKLIRDNLLQGKSAEAHFIGLKNSHNTPSEGEQEAEKQLAHFSLPFDLVILGMGDDGHTASLFPGADNLSSALDLYSSKRCLGITPLSAELDRITLTLPTLLNSRHIYLHLVGKSKQRVYQKAISGTDTNEMPVRSILMQQKVTVDVFWAA